MSDSSQMLEQLRQFLGTEEGMEQFQNAARMLGAGMPADQQSGHVAASSAAPDAATLIKLEKLLGAAQQDSPSSALLRALRPLLCENRRHKVDEALRMMQLFSLLPVLREGLSEV